MKRLKIIAILIAASMTCASLYFRSVRITLSIAAGSAIVIISFELMRIIISRALSSAKTSKTFIVFMSALKFAILGILLWFIVVKLPIHPLAFLVGLMTMVIAITTEGIISRL